MIIGMKAIDRAAERWGRAAVILDDETRVGEQRERELDEMLIQSGSTPTGNYWISASHEFTVPTNTA